MNGYPLLGNTVLVDISERIATVSLNRPEHHNALSRELRVDLAKALECIQNDDDVDIVILTGAGPKSFCVGLDLQEFELSPLAPEEMGPDSPMMRAFANLQKPVIGAVNGFAVAGGFELVCNCDLVVGSTNAKFADTHVRVGVLPGWGISQNLPQIVGPSRARYLAFTANYIDAQTAREWGLLLDVVPPDDLIFQCRKLAQDMLGANQQTLREYRELIRSGMNSMVREGIELEARLARAGLVRFDARDFAKTRSTLMQRGKEQTGSKVG